MFSPLARGKGGWDGELPKLDEFNEDFKTPIEPLLPQLLQSRSSATKSARSFASTAFTEDGQLVLPKTFVTRKGAILLFTPSEELIIKSAQEEQKYLKENVCEAGVKLGTVRNLTRSVLTFGKEKEESWEGIPKVAKDIREKDGGVKRDKMAFLHFLHYLDSDCLTADKAVQPGANPEFYLEELKAKAGSTYGAHSHRRSGCQTPFSAKTSYTNRTCSQYLDDKDEIGADISHDCISVDDYNWSKPQRSPHGIVWSDYDLTADGQSSPDLAESISCSSSPRQMWVQPKPTSVRPSTNRTPTPCQDVSIYPHAGDLSSRPKTAPVPPVPNMCRANPRITSAKTAAHPRVLGSTPEHLQEILNAHVGIGHFLRQSLSPRLKISRTPSPVFHQTNAPSRGESPDYVKMSRLSPGEKLEELNLTDVIEEEDSGYMNMLDFVDSGNLQRPSSADSLYSETQPGEDYSYGLRAKGVSSAGSHSRRVHRPSSHTSRSGSTSSVSWRPARSVSATSRGDIIVIQSPEVFEIEDYEVTEAASAAELATCAEDDAHSSMEDTEGLPSFYDGAGGPSSSGPQMGVAGFRASLSHSVPTSDSPPPTDDIITRDNDAIAARGTSSASHHSMRSSSSMSRRIRHDGAGDVSVMSSSASPHARDIISRQSVVEDAVSPSDGSTVLDGGLMTMATLGSEADVSAVEDMLFEVGPVVNGAESPDQLWPGMDETLMDEQRFAEDKSENEHDSVAEEVDLDLPSSTGDSRPMSPTFVLQDETGANASAFPPSHENEAVTSCSSRGAIEKSTEPAVLETVATDIQFHSPTPVPVVNSVSSVPEDNDESSPAEKWPSRVPTPVPTVNTSDILHTKLLTHPQLETMPAPYKETIDIESSRPSSPVSAEARTKPVDVGRAVMTYIESGHEPQIRVPSERSRPGSPAGSRASDQDHAVSKEAEASKRTESESEKDDAKTSLLDSKLQARSASHERNIAEKSTNKLRGSVESTGDNLKGLNLISKSKEAKPPEPTDEERMATRQLVSSFMARPKPPDRGRLELEGIGKEGEEDDVSSVEVKTVKPIENEKKFDLSDLASRTVQKPKPAKAYKDKKPLDSKKNARAKSLKSSKKEVIAVDPNNIDLATFSSADMQEHMDAELRQFIEEEQNKSEITKGNQTVRKESVQTLEMPKVADNVPKDAKGAHSPSKVKKPSKKELAQERALKRKLEREKKEKDRKLQEEEKKRREEEMRLIKEREEEKAQARSQAELKQRALEEEKSRRMEEEEEAKKQEEEALEKLKEAKKKAREEREGRRAAEAERRRLEVQKKREEKKRREEELREHEKELEKQRMDQERRKQEMQEVRRRQKEMERLEEEALLEEERLRALHEEEEQHRMEDEEIREAEEELRRLQEEREYREQMRRIAEAQELKLKREEEERKRSEEEDRLRADEEKRRLDELQQQREHEERRRLAMARKLEAVMRMRSAQAAARRKTMLLRRREENLDRMQHLKRTRHGQGVTQAFTFSYYLHIPKSIWEVPIGFNTKKKGFRPRKRKPPQT